MSYRHRMAEGAIRDLPAIKRDVDSLKLALDAQAMAGGCLLDEPAGGPGRSAQDRYLDRYNNRLLNMLVALLNGIYAPYCQLPAPERRVLALRYWQKLEIGEVARELGFTERHVYRLLGSALDRLFKPLLPVQPLLEEWRTGALK